MNNNSFHEGSEIPLKGKKWDDNFGMTDEDWNIYKGI